MSPVKFFEVAFFVICVALMVLVRKAVTHLACDRNYLRSFSCSLSILEMVSSKWRLIALV
jgi:hypothetical protein